MNCFIIRDLTLLCFFVLVMLFAAKYAQAQDSTHQIAEVERFKHDIYTGCFKLSHLPLGRELEECQKRNRPFEWRKTRGCKAIVRKIEKALNEELVSDGHSDLEKSMMYNELFRVRKYLKNTDLALLDSSVLLFSRGIQHVCLPKFHDIYYGSQSVYLYQPISEMCGVMESRYRREWNEIREKHYLVHLDSNRGGHSFDNEWIEANYYVYISMLMYRKGYYRMANEYLNYQGLEVGNTYLDNNRVNGIEYRKQVFYAKSIKQLYDQSEIDGIQLEALSDIYVERSKYRIYAYTHFGLHLIKIDLQMTQNEAEELSNEELMEDARITLKKSVIFNELRKE